MKKKYFLHKLSVVMLHWITMVYLSALFAVINGLYINRVTLSEIKLFASLIALIVVLMELTRKTLKLQNDLKRGDLVDILFFSIYAIVAGITVCLYSSMDKKDAYISLNVLVVSIYATIISFFKMLHSIRQSEEEWEIERRIEMK